MKIAFTREEETELARLATRFGRSTTEELVRDVALCLLDDPGGRLLASLIAKDDEHVPLTSDFYETVRTRLQRNPGFRDALANECSMADDQDLVALRDMLDDRSTT